MASGKRYFWVVIIDNNSRFVMNCRRILAREIGYGPGNEMEYANASCPGVNMWLRNERLRLTHIYAGSEVLAADQLSEFKRSFDSAVGYRVLVDVVGDERGGYDPAEVLSDLVAAGINPKYIDVLSSYEVGKLTVESRSEPARMVSTGESKSRKGPEAFVIAEKSPRLLHSLRGQIDIRLSRAASKSSTKAARDTGSVSHVLITGAGFENRNEQGAPGVPGTSELLRNFSRKFNARWSTNELFATLGRLVLRDRSAGFPEMTFEKLDCSPWNSKMSDASKDSNLDTWWDILLQYLGQGVDLTRSEEDLRYRREEELRSIFRAELEAADWGYLTQALTAARLDWRTWLSTNYTRFADRAISQEEQRLTRSAVGGSSSLHRSWSRISIAAEADALASRLEYSIDELRILFKLHGDIAHLNTMAIAGMDKRMASPHAVKVADIFRNYLVAGSYFTALRSIGSDSSNEGRECTFCWHIVGHGLWDSSLVNLLQRSMRPEDQVVIVDKDASKISGIEHRLKVNTSENSAHADIRTLSYIKTHVTVHRVPRSAADYFHEMELCFQDGRLPKDVGQLRDFLDVFRDDSV